MLRRIASGLIHRLPSGEVKSIRVLSAAQSHMSDRDFTYSLAGNRYYKKTETPPKTPTIDEAIQLDRNMSYPPLDQGDSSACVGFAVCSSADRKMFINGSMRNPLILWKAAKELDEYRSGPTTFVQKEGTSIKAAMAALCKYGTTLLFAPTAEFPDEFAGTYREFLSSAAGSRMAGYQGIQGIGAVSQYLDESSTNSVIACIKVTQAFTSLNKHDFRVPHMDSDQMMGLHAVTIIGKVSSSDGSEQFLMRNSWGTEWGYGGYAVISAAVLASSATEFWGFI